MLAWLAHTKSMIKNILSFVIVIFPSSLKLFVYRRVFGYKIGKHVKIGLSWIRVGHLEIGDYVVIGNLNRFKDIPEVQIGDHTRIGLGNTFTSTHEFIDKRRIALKGNCPALRISSHCGISMLHYFDVQDTLSIGAFTTIAGIGSVFFTHYLDVINATQSTRPIRIGKYCMIGSNARFVPGAGVADYSVVGMGAVVTKLFADTHILIGGNPAIVVRDLPEDAAYFKRAAGWIGEFAPPPPEARRTMR